MKISRNSLVFLPSGSSRNNGCISCRGKVFQKLKKAKENLKEEYDSGEIKIFRDLLDSSYIMKEIVDFSSTEIMTSILTVLAKYSETGEEFFAILNGNPQPDVSQLIWQFLSVKQAQIRIQAIFKYTTIKTVSANIHRVFAPPTK